MSETKFVMVHVMVGEKSEASEIARAVVGQRLAACANILPGARSVYWWNGSLEEADECLLVLKTRRELAERLVAEIARLHSYECPGPVILPIDGGYSPYFQWLVAETAEATTDEKDQQS